MATLDQIRKASQPPPVIRPDGLAASQKTAAQAMMDLSLSQQMTRKPLRDIVSDGRASDNEPKCPRCRDMSWVEIFPEHPDYAAWVESTTRLYGYATVGMVPCPECVQRRHVEYLSHLQEISGLSPTHRLLTLDMIETGPKRPRTTVMVGMARMFLLNPYGFLTFHGPYGNGKTTALMAIVNACVEKGIPAIYITFGDLIGYARAAFATQGESDWERIRRLADVQVLCIDEMSPDQVKETDYVRMIQSQVVNARYVSGEAGNSGTVIAGNFTLFDEDDLPTVPDWIATRLKQGVTVWNDDADYRPQLGERK